MGWVSYNTKYMVASVSSSTTCAPLVDFTLCYFVITSSWMTMYVFFLFLFLFNWCCEPAEDADVSIQKHPFICLKVWVIFKETSVHLNTESQRLVSENAVTVPVYLCISLQCTYVHNFVKTLRNYTNLFMSSFFM